MHTKEMRTRLRRYRDEVAGAIRLARPDIRFTGRSTDEEQRARTREIVAMLSQDSSAKAAPA
jgi:hypothetical protein